MRVCYGFDELGGLRSPVVSVGSYDGVHRGHRQLLARIVALARESGGESVVVTFAPHPRIVLGGGDIHLLNSLEEKRMLLESVGIDVLVVARFDEDFSRVTSYDFVRDYLIRKIGVRTLVVGYDHRFGHDQQGNFGYLSRLQEEFGFRVVEVSRQEVDNHKISSTTIRHLIGEGKMDEAARYLGFPYFILVKIGRGGAVLIDEPAKLLPPPGDYTTVLWQPEALNYSCLYITAEGTVRAETSFMKAPESLVAGLPPLPKGFSMVLFV